MWTIAHRFLTKISCSYFLTKFFSLLNHDFEALLKLTERKYLDPIFFYVFSKSKNYKIYIKKFARVLTVFLVASNGTLSKHALRMVRLQHRKISKNKLQFTRRHAKVPLHVRQDPFLFKLSRATIKNLQKLFQVTELKNLNPFIFYDFFRFSTLKNKNRVIIINDT